MRSIPLLLVFLPLSSCFVAFKSRRLSLKLASEPDDDENGERGKSRRKGKRRFVDYPSFAYNARGQYERMRQTSAKDAPPFDFVATYRSNRPRTVSIPDKISTENQTILEKIANYITSANSGFGSEFTQVANSAVETRLLNNRCYARKEAFTAENITAPPSLADLAAPSAKPLERVWISSPFRIATFSAAYFSFPYLTEFLYAQVTTMDPEQLDEITSKFGPGISILYGTFVSLTLSILYNRQRAIQNTVAQESSLLTMTTRSMLSLFKKDKEKAVLAGQCAADQIRTLVRGSRGGELMLMMYSDPYDRMMELLDFHEDDLIVQGLAENKGGLISSCRDTLKDLNRLRASRLSDEALALPPTHFIILNLLTCLILLGYTISILPTVDVDGVPSLESSLLFGILCTVYVLFYNFASDLNSPFEGVYQVRRSSTASHLLEAKWLIANHPLLRGEVDFEEIKEEPNGDVLIRSPGLGDLMFEKDDLFPDLEANDIELDDAN